MTRDDLDAAHEKTEQAFAALDAQREDRAELAALRARRRKEDMMEIKQYPAPVLEAWATWEVMRQLGFSADDIFWIVALTANAVPRPGLALNVRLATQGRELLVTCSGALERIEAEALLKRGIEFSDLVNAHAFDEAEMTAVLHDSYIWRNKAAFLAVLLGKGFVIPPHVFLTKN